MVGSEIYSDFKDDIGWICDRVREDVINLPPGFRQIGERLITERLFIGTDWDHKLRLDPEAGRPVSYSIFWFADALGVKDSNLIRSLALAMAYSLLVTTLRDDAVDDKKMKEERPQLLSLAHTFQQKYLGIFEKAFGRRSSIWHYLALAIDEHLRYESWNRAFTLDLCKDPFSAIFLEDSSRYLAALALPSLAALTIASNKEDRMTGIYRFVRHFSMGWRVYDDINDWRIDLAIKGMNHSSFLQYARQCIGTQNKIDEYDIISLLLDDGFIRKVYAPVLFYFRKAREDILPFNSHYLTKFMDEQLNLNVRMRNALLRIRLDFYNQLEDLLRANCDP